MAQRWAGNWKDWSSTKLHEIVSALSGHSIDPALGKIGVQQRIDRDKAARKIRIVGMKETATCSTSHCRGMELTLLPVGKH